jgi:uncharacterized protein (DUF1501 family)
MSIPLNRRHFITTAAAAVVAPQFSVRWAKAAAPTDRALVVVFLRGGMDVFNFLAPVEDKNYLQSRPVPLRVGTTGDQKGHVIAGLKDHGDFLLHANAKPIAELFKQKKLAMIPASGLHNATRSHFQAMDLIERGVSSDSGSLPRDGWLTRLAAASGETLPGSVICVGGAMPQSLSLCEEALPVSDVWDISWMPSQSFGEALLELHAGDDMLDRMSRQAITASSRFAQRLLRDGNDQPVLQDVPKGIGYPDHDFGLKLRFLAEMMRIEPQVHVATVDLDDWDTHDNQADRFGERVNALSQGLRAFHDHLDAIGRPTTVVVMSEFGRRLKANESRGTDHGHGGVMMVMGPDVSGGELLGTWPGLDTSQLDQGMDLAVTTDMRDVLATVLQQQGHAQAISAAFPGYVHKPVAGLFRS